MASGRTARAAAWRDQKPAAVRSGARAATFSPARPSARIPVTALGMWASVTRASMRSARQSRSPSRRGLLAPCAAMDEAAARKVLVAVEREAGGGAILWRGAGLDGSDVDVLVLPESEARVNSALAGAGL